MLSRHLPSDPTIDKIAVSTYTIPTDYPESDGTFAWNKTTVVLVEAHAGGDTGIGYSYADLATARLIAESLAPVVQGRSALAIPGAWEAMRCAIRNLGRPGLSSMAISAVDNALWDLKAKVLGVSLVNLLGPAKQGITAYGSGGFTSYSITQLQHQLGDWATQGLTQVKMKIGTHPADDPDRIRAAREAIGPAVELYVDANGAYQRKQALAQAVAFAEMGVTWFEEPVPSDDLDGLRLLRDRGPAGMDVAAGEYGYDLPYFARMLDAGAVDILQADATRCAGITEFLRVGALCAARSLRLSAHTAPSIHAHPCCSLAVSYNVEYFHDHARIEHLLFDGALTPINGELRPDRSRPGLGLELKRADAAKYAD